MALFRGTRVPADIDAVLARGRGERVLAVARETTTGAYLVATTTRVAHVPEQPSAGSGATSAATGGPGVPATPSGVAERSRAVLRPWHEIASGAWEPMTGTISVTWADGARAAQWTLGEKGERFAQVFYDRVAASVVADVPVELDGQVLGRVAIRRNLGGGGLLRQTIWSRRRRDDAAEAHAQVLLDHLAEEVGLD